MRTPSLLVIAATALLSACTPANPVTYAAEKIEVTDAFSRPAAAGANGAGFFSLANRNDGPDRLVRVESPIAGRVEIHETSTKGGIMRMEELKDGLPLKAGETVTFQPGGKHVMFIGLKEPLVVGGKVPATLVFEKAGRAPIELTVQARGEAAGGGGDHHAH